MDIKITDLAREKLIESVKGKEEKPLRIYLAGYGWGGPSFALALDEQKDGDAKMEVDEFTFVIEDELLDTFPAFTVDYSDSFLRKGFSIMPS